jgi:hypothetical protein
MNDIDKGAFAYGCNRRHSQLVVSLSRLSALGQVVVPSCAIAHWWAHVPAELCPELAARIVALGHRAHSPGRECAVPAGRVVVPEAAYPGPLAAGVARQAGVVEQENGAGIADVAPPKVWAMNVFSSVRGRFFSPRWFSGGVSSAMMCNRWLRPFSFHCRRLRRNSHTSDPHLAGS